MIAANDKLEIMTMLKCIIATSKEKKCSFFSSVLSFLFSISLFLCCSPIELIREVESCCCFLLYLLFVFLTFIDKNLTVYNIFISRCSVIYNKLIVKWIGHHLNIVLLNLKSLIKILNFPLPLLLLVDHQVIILFWKW